MLKIQPGPGIKKFGRYHPTRYAYAIRTLTRLLSRFSGSKVCTEPLVEEEIVLFLPATPSSRSQTIEGLFEVTQRPSRALHLTPYRFPEVKKYKNRYVALPLG